MTGRGTSAGAMPYETEQRDMSGVERSLTRRAEREVEVVCCPDGPFLVRGADVIRDEEGIAQEVTRPVVAVCRCGKTSRAPWCDGTHKVLNNGRP